MKTGFLTCCQWSSSDGWAEKYPVSCMSCNSLNMFPLGRISMVTAADPFVTGELGTKRTTSNQIYIYIINQQEEPGNQQTKPWRGTRWYYLSFLPSLPCRVRGVRACACARVRRGGLDGKAARSLSARRYAARGSNACTYTQQVAARTRAYHRGEATEHSRDVTAAGWPTGTDTERDGTILYERDAREGHGLTTSFFRARTDTTNQRWNRRFRTVRERSISLLSLSLSPSSDSATGVLLLLPTPALGTIAVEKARGPLHDTYVYRSRGKTHWNAAACPARRSVCSR